jgi:hypothetical protein
MAVMTVMPVAVMAMMPVVTMMAMPMVPVSRRNGRQSRAERERPDDRQC